MKKQTLASRVLAFLKGGDESKLARFEAKLDKYFSKQVKMREEEIESLQEKITDATEDLQETVVNVNVDRISSTEGAEDYVVYYLEAVSAKQAVIDSLKDSIKDLEEEIEELKKLQETVYSVA